MKLSYIDILDDGKRHTIKATITTEHPASSYGQPVLLLDTDGAPLNLESWVLMAYQVIQIDKSEIDLMRQWIGNVNAAIAREIENPAAVLGSKGGHATSDAKTKANRAKSNLPPKPGHKPRGRPRKEK